MEGADRWRVPIETGPHVNVYKRAVPSATTESKMNRVQRPSDRRLGPFTASDAFFALDAIV